MTSEILTHITIDPRHEAAWAVVRAMRTGEITHARIAHAHLAPNVAFTTAKDIFRGFEDVAERLTGQWTYTPVLALGVWDVRTDDTGAICATADFDGIGAAPRDYRLEFEFDSVGRVITIRELSTPPPPPIATDGMAPWLRRCIDRALADGRPITVSYVGTDGAPHLSLRGSLQTIDDRHIGLWIRKPTGGLADAIAAGQVIAFLYRDSTTRTTLIGRCNGRMLTADAERAAIYDIIPEVEQRHDPFRKGAAAILLVSDIRGTSRHGPVAIGAVDIPH